MGRRDDAFGGRQVMTRGSKSAYADQPGRLSTLLWIVAGLVVVCAVVVAAAPANWIARYVASRSDGRILLADARGTVWRGNAVLAFAEHGGVDAGAVSTSALALPGRLNWAVEVPDGLALVLLLTHDGVLQQPVRVRLGFGSRVIEVAAGAASLPAALLRLAGPPLNTLRPEGRLAVQWDAFAIAGGKPLVAAGTVRVGDLAVAISPVRPLGDYRVAWNSDQRGLTWRLDTERGPLQIEGSGTLAQHVRVSLVARVANDAPPQTAARLKPLLDAMGRRSGDAAVIEIGT